MSLAMRYPDKVCRMLLIDSAPVDGLPLSEDSDTRIELLHTHYGVLKRSIGAVMGTRSKDTRMHKLLTKEALLMNRDTYFDHARALAEFDYSEEAAGFATPTLVIRGAKDRLISQEQAENTAAALHAELKVFDDVGHALPIEDPDLFTQVVREFDSH